MLDSKTLKSNLRNSNSDDVQLDAMLATFGKKLAHMCEMVKLPKSCSHQKLRTWCETNRCDLKCFHSECFCFERSPKLLIQRTCFSIPDATSDEMLFRTSYHYCRLSHTFCPICFNSFPITRRVTYSYENKWNTFNFASQRPFELILWTSFYLDPKYMYFPNNKSSPSK